VSARFGTVIRVEQSLLAVRKQGAEPHPAGSRGEVRSPRSARAPERSWMRKRAVGAFQARERSGRNASRRLRASSSGSATAGKWIRPEEVWSGEADRRDLPRFVSRACRRSCWADGIAVRGSRRFVEEVVRQQRDRERRVTYSSPLPIYTAQRGLLQAPVMPHNRPPQARTSGNGRAKCMCC